MSDSPAGPDWWLASDGKWYPPTSQPGSAPPGPKPAWVGPALSGWLQGLFWVVAVLCALGAAATLRALSAFNAYASSSSLGRWSAWVDADDAFALVVGIAGVLAIPIGVLLVIWTYKVSQTVDRFAPVHRSWNSGWAIGAWFIPLGGIVLCKLVLNELERLAFAPRSNGVVTPEWRRQGTRPLGWIWWMSYMGGVALVLAGGISVGDSGGHFNAADSEIRTYYILNAIGLVVFTAAAASGALYVREVSRPLSPRALGDAWH